MHAGSQLAALLTIGIAIMSSQHLFGVVLHRGLPDIFSKGAEEQLSEMLP